MPLQNRVTPFGEIIRTAARGTMMGNRGIIHDSRSKRLLARRWQHQSWICCALEFKGFQHPIMGAGSYTELFFLDEVTAFAAGHRPCAYCRRRDFNAFKLAWVEANAIDRSVAEVRAASIDHQIHCERVTRRREKITFEAQLGALPDGTFVADRGEAFLVSGKQLFVWRPEGYGAPVARGNDRRVTVLTPRSVVAAFRQGHRPLVHPTASTTGSLLETQ
jgi:hypothetical protein